LRDTQKASTPPLLPLLRSRLQAEVLTLVLLNPQQEWSLTGLASRVGASVSSVQREITRAEQAGVVSSRRLGNVRLVKAGNSPLTVPLTELLLRSFGPRQVLAEELEGVEGIEKVNVTIRSPAWWREGTDGFHADVTQRPLVPIFSEEEPG
jgi:hypothetical protein